MEVDPLDVNGNPPELSGQTCEALLVRQYWYKGELAEPANVVYVCFDGTWHRLYFDCGIIFWRPQKSAPETWKNSEKYDYPLIDLAKQAQFKGATLLRYEMQPIQGGSQVIFHFEGNRRAVFKNVQDRTEYAV